MSGKLAPETVKPVPVTVAALTVTEAVPEEVKVTDCVAGEFRTTSPKATLVALTLSVEVAAEIVSVKAALPVPILFVALSVTVDVPAVVGVPEINPVLLVTVSPAGKPVAL